MFIRGFYIIPPGVPCIKQGRGIGSLPSPDFALYMYSLGVERRIGVMFPAPGRESRSWTDRHDVSKHRSSRAPLFEVWIFAVEAGRSTLNPGSAGILAVRSLSQCQYCLWEEPLFGVERSLCSDAEYRGPVTKNYDGKETRHNFGDKNRRSGARSTRSTAQTEHQVNIHMKNESDWRLPKFRNLAAPEFVRLIGNHKKHGTFLQCRRPEDWSLWICWRSRFSAVSPAAKQHRYMYTEYTLHTPTVNLGGQHLR